MQAAWREGWPAAIRRAVTAQTACALSQTAWLPPQEAPSAAEAALSANQRRGAAMLAASRQRRMDQPLKATPGSCVTQCPLHPAITPLFSEEGFRWVSTWPGADFRRSYTRRDSAVNRTSVCQPRQHHPTDPSPASIDSRRGVNRASVSQPRQHRPIEPSPASIDSRRGVNGTLVRQSRQPRAIVPSPATIDSRRGVNRTSVCHPRQPHPIDPSPASTDSRKTDSRKGVNRASVSQPRQPRPTDRSPAAIDRRRAITDRL